LNIIIYNTRYHPVIQVIKTRALKFTNCMIIQVTDYKPFKKKLSACFAGECIIIFFVTREKDIVFLESMEKNFVDIKLLIHLDIEDATIASRAYALSPRLVTDNDSCKDLLPSALEGIIKHLKRQTYK